VLDLVDAQHSRDHLSSLPSSTIFFQSSPRRKVDRERHHELDYSRDADVALRVNAAARADLVGEGDGVRRIGLVSPGRVAAAGYPEPAGPFGSGRLV
jgi:hypothetical protein